MFVVLCISTIVSEKSGLPILGVEVFCPADEGCIFFPILGVGVFCPEDEGCIFFTNVGANQLNYAAPCSGIL